MRLCRALSGPGISRGAATLVDTTPEAVPTPDLARQKEHRWQAWYNVSLVWIVAWVANYLHFTRYGLYEDDWYFSGYPFFVDFKSWMVGALFGEIKNSSVGRPLQLGLAYVFGEIGAAANSISLDYCIAFLCLAVSATLMYVVLRHRFSSLVSTLAALLFVITPLHTLRQFLNGEYTFGPGFILIFGAMLLYRRGHRVWSYFVASLCLVTYESIYFLFLGAPLLERTAPLRGRRREWLIHLAVCVATVGVYFWARKVLVMEERVGALPSGGRLLWPVLHSWLFGTLASFVPYVYGLLKAPEAGLEAWVFLVPFWALLAGLFYLSGPRMSAPNRAAGFWQQTAIALSFVALGYVVSYFFFLETNPSLHLVERESRISVAASFGSSLLVALWLAGVIHAAGAGLRRIAAYVCVVVFLSGLFLYSFVVQDDYAKDWTKQREEAQQVISLTPDVQPDTLIVLKLKVPDVSSLRFGGSRRPSIGLEKYLYERMFQRLFGGDHPWPELMVVYSDDWTNYLKRDPDGLMNWKQPIFPGRWNPVSRRFLPGRLIVIQEAESGRLIRKPDSILVDGTQIVQKRAADNYQVPLWDFTVQNGLNRWFLPDLVRKSEASINVVGWGNPRLLSPVPGTTLRRPGVTFTWTAVRNAKDYWIDVGTAAAKGDLFAGYTSGATTATVDLSGGLTGKPVYVQLYSKLTDSNPIPGTGAKYEFRTGPMVNPQLVSPAPGTVLTSPLVTFVWNAVPDATDYWIDVGTARGKGNIDARFTAGTLSETVPLAEYLNGKPLYVQLYAKFPEADLVPGTGSMFEFATLSPARKQK